MSSSLSLPRSNLQRQLQEGGEGGSFVHMTNSANWWALRNLKTDQRKMMPIGRTEVPSGRARVLGKQPWGFWGHPAFGWGDYELSAMLGPVRATQNPPLLLCCACVDAPPFSPVWRIRAYMQRNSRSYCISYNMLNMLQIKNQ